MKRRWFAVGLAALAAVGGWYWLGLGEVPSGQQPLVEMQSLEKIREEFNRAADSARVIVLLSPT